MALVSRCVSQVPIGGVRPSLLMRDARCKVDARRQSMRPAGRHLPAFPVNNRIVTDRLRAAATFAKLADCCPAGRCCAKGVPCRIICTVHRPGTAPAVRSGTGPHDSTSPAEVIPDSTVAPFPPPGLRNDLYPIDFRSSRTGLFPVGPPGLRTVKRLPTPTSWSGGIGRGRSSGLRRAAGRPGRARRSIPCGWHPRTARGRTI